jgi:hypothetical protein
MNGKDEWILNVSSILLSGNDYRLRSIQYINQYQSLQMMKHQLGVISDIYLHEM